MASTLAMSTGPLIVSSMTTVDDHLPGARHPERPERSSPEEVGLVGADVELVRLPRRPATIDELARVHHSITCAACSGSLTTAGATPRGPTTSRSPPTSRSRSRPDVLREPRNEGGKHSARPPRRRRQDRHRPARRHGRGHRPHPSKPARRWLKLERRGRRTRVIGSGAGPSRTRRDGARGENPGHPLSQPRETRSTFTPGSAASGS